MKRFLLFGADEWGQLGGWSDFQGDFDTVDEALESLIALGPRGGRKGKYEWWEVIDSETKRSVVDGGPSKALKLTRLGCGWVVGRPSRGAKEE